MGSRSSFKAEGNKYYNESKAHLRSADEPARLKLLRACQQFLQDELASPPACPSYQHLAQGHKLGLQTTRPAACL